MVGNQRFEVLLPTPDNPTRSGPVAPRIATLRGKTVGFINNGWWSLDLTFDVFEELLFEKYEVAAILKKRKRPEGPLAKPEIEDLAAKADVVISGLGN